MSFVAGFIVGAVASGFAVYYRDQIIARVKAHFNK